MCDGSALPIMKPLCEMTGFRVFLKNFKRQAI
jgi:hypothetical protein